MTSEERARFLNALRAVLRLDPLPTQENYPAYEHVVWTAHENLINDGNRRQAARGSGS